LAAVNTEADFSTFIIHHWTSSGAQLVVYGRLNIHSFMISHMWTSYNMSTSTYYPQSTLYILLFTLYCNFLFNCVLTIDNKRLCHVYVTVFAANWKSAFSISLWQRHRHQLM